MVKKREGLGCVGARLRAIRGCGVHHTPSYRPRAGSYPADVFTSDGTEDAFLKCLGEVCEKPGWTVHGYVDMRNDYHVA